MLSAKIVDGADIHRSGGANDKKRRQPGTAIQRDPSPESCNVDAVGSIGPDAAQGIGAEPGDIHGLFDAAIAALEV